MCEMLVNVLWQFESLFCPQVFAALYHVYGNGISLDAFHVMIYRDLSWDIDKYLQVSIVIVCFLYIHLVFINPIRHNTLSLCSVKSRNVCSRNESSVFMKRRWLQGNHSNLYFNYWWHTWIHSYCMLWSELLLIRLGCFYDLKFILLPFHLQLRLFFGFSTQTWHIVYSVAGLVWMNASVPRCAEETCLVFCLLEPVKRYIYMYRLWNLGKLSLWRALTQWVQKLVHFLSLTNLWESHCLSRRVLEH